MSDNYGLGYQFGDLNAGVSDLVEDNYGLSYQFGGLLAPSSNPTEDNYGLGYQFGDLNAANSSQRCVTVHNRILQRAQNCITTVNRLSRKLRCVTVSTELILYKQRCVLASNRLKSAQNCVTVHNRILQRAQNCITTVNRLNQVVSCISVSTRIGSTLRCVTVSNRLSANIQRCVESRNKLSAKRPVLSCVAVSSAVLQQVTIRHVAALIPGVPDVPTVFISHEELTGPNPPPSMPVQVDSTNAIVSLDVSPVQLIAGDMSPVATGSLCVIEGFKVFLKIFPGANTDYMEIEYATVSIVADQNSYAYELNLTFIDDESWVKVRPLISTIKVTLGTFEWIFLAENRSRSVARQGANYTVFGRSITMVLGDRIARRITKDFEGMMLSDVFEELASAQGISVQYDIVDVEVGVSALSSDNQTPLDIIVSATDNMGGIVKSHPNQQLLIIEYPIDTEVAPVQRELTFVNSVDTLSEQWGWKPAWTSVIVSDEALTSDADKDKTIRLSQVGDKIRAFTVPFRAISLSDSANPGTDLIFEGEHFEEISETVTIICGEASLSKPFHEIISVNWLREDLGAISVEESGAITTELDGNSLLDVTYSTRFQQWGYLMEDDKTLVYANEI